MNWIVAKIRWVMLAAGALSCSMLYAAVKPSEAVDLLFDRALESLLAEVVVPAWAALLGLLGGMLLYGALVPQARTLILTVASAGKLVLPVVMLVHGRRYLDEGVVVLIAFDLVMVALFVAFLIGVRRSGALRARAEPSTVSLAPRSEPEVRATPRPPLAKAR
jgi:hypothetical protein